MIRFTGPVVFIRLTSIGGDISPVQVVRLEELVHGQRGREVRGGGETRAARRGRRRRRPSERGVRARWRETVAVTNDNIRN